MYMYIVYVYDVYKLRASHRGIHASQSTLSSDVLCSHQSATFSTKEQWLIMIMKFFRYLNSFYEKHLIWLV